MHSNLKNISVLTFIALNTASDEVNSATKKDCDHFCAHGPDLKLFYVKDEYGHCLLMPHECMLEKFNCEHPGHGLVRVLDDSCGHIEL